MRVQYLIRRALRLLRADLPIPVDLAFELAEAGVDVEAL